MQVSPMLKKRIKAISKSGFLHSKWYLKAYPDVEALGMTPAEHYLRFGDMMGRSPGTSFDAQFYRQIWGDFIRPGETALESYLRVEREAGHSPRKIKPQLQMVRRLSRHLWGGCVVEAIERLEAISRDPGSGRDVVVFALCQLAARRHFDGDLDGAAACLDRIPPGMSGRALSNNPSLLRAIVALDAGDAERAQTAMEGIQTRRAGDRVLAASLLEEDDEARLDLLSKAYYDDGMIGLSRRDPRAPLTIDNLRGDAVLPRMPSIGTVSVIIPAYKSEASLEIALRSLLEQSYPDLEILVVDDCSPDGTYEVARRVAQEDARVRPLRMPRNAGAYPARNYGLRQATGAFITTHDADDWSHPQKIEWQIRAFLHDPDIKATAVYWARCRHDLRFTTNWRLEDRIMHWSYSSFMMRREVAKTLGPWDEVRSGADTEMVWRFNARYGEAAFVKVHSAMPLAFALDDAESLTRSKASHVVTNYHGLRLLYREVSRYHLAVEGAGTEAAAAWLTPPGHGRLGSPAEKMARVPVEMRGGTVDETGIDLVIEVDLFDAGQVDRTVAFLRDHGAPGKTGLLHTPGIESDARRFALSLWEVLDGERVVFLVPGLYKNGGKARLAVADLPDETDPSPGTDPTMTNDSEPKEIAPDGRNAPMFISTRQDGFGERLRALLNAMTLSELTDSRFGFQWNERSGAAQKDHAIRSADETFSQDFLDCHRIDPDLLDGSGAIELSNLDAQLVSGRMPQVDFVTVQQSPIERQVPQFAHSVTRPENSRKQFEAIGFSESLERARLIAKTVDLPDDVVALHLRAGDIIHGRYRSAPRFYRKACPYPVAQRIIEDEQQAGRQVLVFGQDRQLIETFQNRYGILTVQEFEPEPSFDELQQALFEICLMARCGRIIAGSSGFATVASLISGVGIVSPYRIYPRDEAAALIWKTLDETGDGVPDLQKAFAYGSAFSFLKDGGDPELRCRLAGAALDLDPGNEFHAVTLAVHSVRMGRVREADEIILRMFRTASPDTPGIADMFGAGRIPKKDFHGKPLLDVLRDAAMKGSAGATLCMILAERALGNVEEAKRFAYALRERAGEDYGAYEKILSEIEPEVMLGAMP